MVQARLGSEVRQARIYRQVAIDHKGRGGMKGASIVSVALAPLVVLAGADRKAMDSGHIDGAKRKKAIAP